MQKRNMYSLCEAHFESFKERCLDYKGDPTQKPRECQGTYDFLAECVELATVSCCEKEAAEFRSICEEAAGEPSSSFYSSSSSSSGTPQWVNTQECRATTGRLARCMAGTFGIKDRIDLQSAEDRDLDRRLRDEEAERERNEALQRAHSGRV